MDYEQLIARIHQTEILKRAKGDRFEQLIKNYLQTDNNYARQIKQIWLWEEFPYASQFSGSDTGIDLVARTEDGWWAIQCKCFAEDNPVNKSDIDSFLSLSSRTFEVSRLGQIAFSQRLLVTSNSNLGPHARSAIANQIPRVVWINGDALARAAVEWGKLDEGVYGRPAHRLVFEPRPHQKEAIQKAKAHFAKHDRGKLIMACGAGKTLTSLRIAEELTNQSGWVLFLVPSIALLSQTLREWGNQVRGGFSPICVCSDEKISARLDSLSSSVVDIPLPASTDIDEIKLRVQYCRTTDSGLRVIFSTYQSIGVVIDAQKQLGLEFDLTICDEAHRTTGITYEGDDVSGFNRVHRQIRSKKLMYMTATPRIYEDNAKAKATENNTLVYSMDDPELYGQEFHRLGFGKAVEQNLLSDYKVVILTLNEELVPAHLQRALSNENQALEPSDLHKLVGCIDALSKHIIGDGGALDGGSLAAIMKRSVAFCSKIKVSDAISQAFNDIGPEYKRTAPPAKQVSLAVPVAKHVDGTMNASERNRRLAWLKDETGSPDESRILTNVRCLSEGVDVPSLDAVMFLSAKSSQIDVVQSVGRVMRKSPGKKYGYIIIPIIIPAGLKPEVVLDQNKPYKVVWQVLNALRAHDERFRDVVNKIALNKVKPKQIIVGRPDSSGTGTETTDAAKMGTDELSQQAFDFSQLQNVIYAKLVTKVGEQGYFSEWVASVAELADRHTKRISELVQNDGDHRVAFEEFLLSLQRDINPAVTAEQAIEMLSQHIISKPVFEALFEESSFAKNNAVSQAMDKILQVIEAQSLDSEDRQELEEFYNYVRRRASGIDNAQGKQKVITELYDKFFKAGFPRLVEQLGIVYTPIEIVDFIIHSVDDVLRQEFDACLSDENVNILDPFTGTGTFITRLLQSGLIRPQDLKRKYTQEIFANEVVLLAYYIAAVNIENAYHDLVDDKSYTSFPGIVLADTFQMSEDDQTFAPSLQENSERIKKQKASPIRVIISNPPYSVGQKSANDAAANQEYPKLHHRIKGTYALLSTGQNLNALYDSYIKAFRWSTDRLDPNGGGIIAFVSNGSWLDDSSKDGFRVSLEKEFSSIYVFNLRGNQRTSGELSRREGGKIFGAGSRTPVAITLLVKKPGAEDTKASIYYHDIGDYLKRDSKLQMITEYRSVFSDTMLPKWQTIKPNLHNDWIDQRVDFPEGFIRITQARDAILPERTPGSKSNRDAWTYNFSGPRLKKNIQLSVDFYNLEVDRYKALEDQHLNATQISEFTDNDPKHISWSQDLRQNLRRMKKYQYNQEAVRPSLYRPFNKQWLYFDRSFIDRPRQFPKLISPQKENRFIVFKGRGSRSEWSALITDQIADVQLLGNAVCVPLYLYGDLRPDGILGVNSGGGNRRVNVGDATWRRARSQYGSSISQEDIFYYVYGFLHSNDYRQYFASSISKGIPRIPLVDKTGDFHAFVDAGRKLSDLHIDYEQVAPYPNLAIDGLNSKDFRVEKMKFKAKDQKDAIIFNRHITISQIPDKAYDYVLNGKSAIEWVMDRYQIRQDKPSGIINDPNDWGKEIGNPRYILDLLASVVNVSVKTVDIVNDLPKINFKD